MLNNEPNSSSDEDTKTNGKLIKFKRRQVRIMAEEERINTDKWLSMLNQVYDDLNYSPSQRIAYTVKLLDDEQKVWYEQHKDDIKEDWSSFREQLKQHVFNNKLNRTTTSLNNTLILNNTEVVALEDFIGEKFEKYSGVGDAKNWLLQTMNQFKICGLRRDDQVEAVPFLLEGDAYLWYANNSDTIHNFETFSKLLLQQFKYSTPTTIESPVGTTTKVVTVPDVASASHLQRTLADEIIKRPTYFRGSQDDVHDWLDKLEQRFTMAQWNDENKLQYISIHLQDDAYRWWMQTSSTIKSWSVFKDAVIRAFGSTRSQELAFEQLKWYKQTINQSITQYYEKIIELCKKVDPTMPDSLKLKYLMAGIKESLKTHVALEDPKSSEAFLLSARKIEDIFALTSGNTEFIPNDVTLNVTNYQGQPGQPNQTSQLNYSQPNNKNFNRNNPQSASTQRNHSTYYRNTSTRNQLSQQNKQWKSKRSTQRSNACFNCGTLGHYARDCTRPHFQ